MVSVDIKGVVEWLGKLPHIRVKPCQIPNLVHLFPMPLFLVDLSKVIVFCSDFIGRVAYLWLNGFPPNSTPNRPIISTVKDNGTVIYFESATERAFQKVSSTHAHD